MGEWDLRTLGDLDRGGLADLLIEHSYSDTGGGETMTTILPGEALADIAVIPWSPDFGPTWWRSGPVPVAVGDFDGDGVLDLAVEFGVGRVPLIWGPLPEGELDLFSLRVRGDRDGADDEMDECAHAGIWIDGATDVLADGDLDGDGRDDLVLQVGDEFYLLPGHPNLRSVERLSPETDPTFFRRLPGSPEVEPWLKAVAPACEGASDDGAAVLVGSGEETVHWIVAPHDGEASEMALTVSDSDERWRTRCNCR